MGNTRRGYCPLPKMYKSDTGNSENDTKVKTDEDIFQMFKEFVPERLHDTFEVEIDELMGDKTIIDSHYLDWLEEKVRDNA